MAPVRRAAAALALCLAARTAGAEDAPPRCTLPDVGDWREYRSAHFVLSTDVARDRAPGLVRQLEELRSLVVAALFGDAVEIPGRVHAVAFSSPLRYAQFAAGPARTFGYAFASDGESWIVFPYDGREPPGFAVAHELAHGISWHQFPRQPPWFREGLAQFVETVGEERHDPRAAAVGSHVVRGARETSGRWAGYPSPEILDRVKHSTTVSARQTLEWSGQIDESDPSRFHAASWLLYHFLWNQRSSQLTAYQERLAKGEEPRAAWAAAFPDLDPANGDAMARLDRELAAYRHDARYVAYPVRVGNVDGAFVDRAVPTAELHLLLARIRRSGTDAERKERARDDYAEAFREDPLLPAAAVAHARQEKASIADAMAAVTRARPDDAWGWYFLGAALDARVDPEKKEAALRRAVALAPDEPRPNDALARLLVGSGRAKEARPFAERALDLAPWDAQAVDTLASVAFGIGQCKPALVLQRRAADLFAARDPAGDGFRKRLAEYEATCGATAAPAAGPAN